MNSMIPVKEFAERRRKLMERMAPDSIAIIPAAPERVRNRDVLHPFRQDSDFHYLSGFAEPEAVLALIPGREHGESVLFCKERNPQKELWDGFLVGPEGAIERYGLATRFRSQTSTTSCRAWLRDAAGSTIRWVRTIISTPGLWTGLR